MPRKRAHCVHHVAPGRARSVLRTNSVGCRARWIIGLAMTVLGVVNIVAQFTGASPALAGVRLPERTGTE